MFEKYIRRYARSALDHYEFNNDDLAEIAGYEYYGKLAANIRKRGIDSFVNFLAELQVWGTPEQVFNKLAEHQRRADTAALIGGVQLRRHAARACQEKHYPVRRGRASAAQGA